jgi:hypothetical protein
VHQGADAGRIVASSSRSGTGSFIVTSEALILLFLLGVEEGWLGMNLDIQAVRAMRPCLNCRKFLAGVLLIGNHAPEEEEKNRSLS